MNIDLTQIVMDKMAQMEQEGAVKALIQEQVEEAVTGAIKRVFGGWALQDALEKEMKEYLPDMVKDIGLDTYNAYIAETVKKLAIAGLKENAKNVMNERVNEILCKKRKSILLSELLDEYRRDRNDCEEDEKRDWNEDHDGFTCHVDPGRGSSSQYFKYFDIYLSEEGDIEGTYPDDFDYVIKIQCWTGSHIYGDGDQLEGKIQDIYRNGDRISKQFVTSTPSSFDALLMNLYLNKTEIVMDMDKYDEDDHYYETHEDY